MKIMKKIQILRARMVAPGGAVLAKRLQGQSIKAVLGGNKSNAWKEYMANFHSNSDQFRRLIGEEDAFMNDPSGYGPEILAYLAGDGTCGGGTNLAQITGMLKDKKDFLDNGVDSTTRDDALLPVASVPNVVLEAFNSDVSEE